MTDWETIAVAAAFVGALGVLGFFSARAAGARATGPFADFVERVNDILPQTQCGQCGYPGCRPYARALAAGEAAINLCPPGGAEAIRALSVLLNEKPLALDARLPPAMPPQVAVIRESECVGCALCLPACPVDAIVGAPRKTHTIVADACVGCELCLPPCPVDCIEMRPLEPRPIAAAPSAPALAALQAPPAYDACIKCGFCVPVCPVEIDAADLLAKLIDDDWEAAAARNLSACIECRRCDAVCPSEIPLASILGAGKKSLLAREAQTAAAKIARQRGDERARRLESLEATAPPRVSAAAKKAAIERARAIAADKPR